MAPTTPNDRDRTLPRYSDEQVDEIMKRRAITEQAMGMLMLAQGIDAADAFALLRCRSRTTNVKIGVLAQQIIDDPSSAQLADG